MTAIFKRMPSPALLFGCLLTGLACAANANPTPPTDRFASDPADQDAAYETLLSHANERGTARVIVRLATPFLAEGTQAEKGGAVRQRTRIATQQSDLLRNLLGYSPASVKRFRYSPMVALEVDALGLQMLRGSPLVAAIAEDVLEPALLPQSVPLVGADKAWGAGYTGAGQSVAVLDTGVDRSHPFLAGKVAVEACFSTTYAPGRVTSVCPNGQSQQLGAGAAAPCRAYGCDHGTHVAGIAAGRGTSFSGVARDAAIVAVQVFSQINDPATCSSFGYPTPCALTYSSDVIKGLEYVYQMRNSVRIAATNLSLGGGRYSSYCNSDPRKPAIDNLRSVGIATVIASGNSGFTNALGAPACISTAVSVGATDKTDSVASFSNSAAILNLLAPGDGYSAYSGIYSSVPGGGYDYKPGTSMAAPHVAGAWAVLKAARPAATVDQVLAALAGSGRPVTDYRNGLSKPRIQVDRAIERLIGNFNDDLAIDFGAPPLGSYLWLADKGFTSLIHTLPTQQLATADFDGNGRSDLALAFAPPYTGIWAWVNGVGWARIHSLSAKHLMAADFSRDGRSDLAIDFGAPYDGLWLWINRYGFIKIAKEKVNQLAVGDFDGDGRPDVAVDLGAPTNCVMMWRWGIGWSKITCQPTEKLGAGNFDGTTGAELVLNLGTNGIWLWGIKSGLQQVFDTSNPSGFLYDTRVTDFDVVDFNGDRRSDLAMTLQPCTPGPTTGACPNTGIWAWVNGVELEQIDPNFSYHLTGVDYNRDGHSDLAIDFGPGHGIWAWVNGKGFTARIHPQTARNIASGHFN